MRKRKRQEEEEEEPLHSEMKFVDWDIKICEPEEEGEREEKDGTPMAQVMDVSGGIRCRPICTQILRRAVHESRWARTGTQHSTTDTEQAKSPGNQTRN
jgi:hypothetical protein